MTAIRQQAETLAKRAYISVVAKEMTEANEPVFIARNLEIPNCIAEGDTPEASLQMLAEMREDIIAHMLEFNLPVPDPRTITSGTMNLFLEQSAEHSSPQQSVPLQNVIRDVSDESIAA